MNESVESCVAALLTARKQTLATAESCTGGLVGHRLTNISGSSAFYRGGVIAYDNAVKQQFLGVHAETLARHGAVSEPVAREMAQGIRNALKTDYSISITGIAGPTGGSAEKPVGLVYIGLADTSQCIVLRCVFDGDRHAVKTAASDKALAWLADVLGGEGDFIN